MNGATQLVAILNLTPDSFSDGGMTSTPDTALMHVEKYFSEGADRIDIGAESTRPGAVPISAQEEWRRLAPVLEPIARRWPERIKHISIDTYHPSTARHALEYGVGYINDVTGFAQAEMVDAVRPGDCKLIVMHSLGIPADPTISLFAEEDVIAILCAFGQQRLTQLKNQGVARSRIIFDPGLGFGKTAEQSLTIIRRIGELNSLNVPIMVGHSRKSFLSRFTDAPPAQRDNETLWVSLFLSLQGVEYLRVHDVAHHAQMLRLLEAIR